MSKLVRGIDSLNEWAGRIFYWLIIPMTFVTTYEVVSRYAFNHPTIWAWDINTQLLGGYSLMLGGYALLHNSHVTVDILVAGLSQRKKAILESTLSLLFFCSFGILLWQMSEAAWDSLKIMERSESLFSPPVYPVKILIAVGVLLLLLQGLSKFIKDFNIILHPSGDDVSHGN